MFETFVILHFSASGPKVELAAGHRAAMQLAAERAAEGGQVLLLHGNAALYGQPTSLEAGNAQ